MKLGIKNLVGITNKFTLGARDSMIGGGGGGERHVISFSISFISMKTRLRKPIQASDQQIKQLVN